ncbi:hypothetical protein ABH935_007365 [Catenulispora sp. GAS73]|uniref:hypothetical protein n=1 Tax=Catenulispora sp. GAS73 TaxID=3156269 RepID=UPI0035114E91
MIRTNRHRTACVAALLTLPGALLLAAAPAYAAQPAPAPAAPAHASSASGTAAPPPGSKFIATVTATKKATSGQTGQTGPTTIHCDLYASGLYILQPGAKWGPFTYPFTRTNAMADTAWVVCSAPVPEISVQAQLYVNGAEYPSGYNSYSYNSQVSPTNYELLDGCWQGLWQTAGTTIITTPPGWIPQTLVLSTKSSGVYIPAVDCTPNSQL